MNKESECRACLALRVLSLFFIITFSPLVSLFEEGKSIDPYVAIGSIIMVVILWVYIFKLVDNFIERFPIVMKLILYGPILLFILAVLFGLEPSSDRNRLNVLIPGGITTFELGLSLFILFYALMIFFWFFKIDTRKKLLVLCLKLSLIVSIVGIPFLFIWEFYWSFISSKGKEGGDGEEDS